MYWANHAHSRMHFKCKNVAVCVEFKKWSSNADLQCESRPTCSCISGRNLVGIVFDARISCGGSEEVTKTNRWCMRAVSASSVWLKKRKKKIGSVCVHWSQCVFRSGVRACQVWSVQVCQSFLASANVRRLSVSGLCPEEDPARCCKCSLVNSRGGRLLYSFVFIFYGLDCG